ncbi:MAG: hypothetical protein IT285_04795 [Bdellovibrionales bacterium]|nr:hypothetical protein [Bdellovibrionales bacterium]
MNPQKLFGAFAALSFILTSPSASAASGTNPDVSLNALILGQGLLQRGEPELLEDVATGFGLQEVELRFTSNIDTNFRGDAVLAMHAEDGEYHLEPEEVIVETLSLPGVTLKAGKFYAALGRHNTLHTHAYPFIDAPMVHHELLGHEGLNAPGLSGAVLLPPSWFSELTLQVFTSSEGVLFADGSDSDRQAGLASWRNLWELSDDSTLDLVLAYGRGFGTEKSVLSAALTGKWRYSPEGSFSLTGEYLRLDESAGQNRDGLALWAQYQFAKPWWVQARGEVLGMTGDLAVAETRY